MTRVYWLTVIFLSALSPVVVNAKADKDLIVNREEVPLVMVDEVSKVSGSVPKESSVVVTDSEKSDATDVRLDSKDAETSHGDQSNSPNARQGQESGERQREENGEQLDGPEKMQETELNDKKSVSSTVVKEEERSPETGLLDENLSGTSGQDDDADEYDYTYDYTKLPDCYKNGSVDLTDRVRTDLQLSPRRVLLWECDYADAVSILIKNKRIGATNHLLWTTVKTKNGPADLVFMACIADPTTTTLNFLKSCAHCMNRFTKDMVIPADQLYFACFRGDDGGMYGCGFSKLAPQDLKKFEILKLLEKT